MSTRCICANGFMMVLWMLLVPGPTIGQVNYGPVEPPPGSPDKVEQKDGAPFCWLGTMEEIPVYADPSCKKELKRVGYLEEFYSLWRNDDVVLLVRGKTGTPSESGEIVVSEVLGYARQSDLLVSRNNIYQCLRSENRISRKALVVHRWAKDDAASSKPGLDKAELRYAPDIKATVKQEVNLYDILYVFAFSIKEKDRETDPGGFCFVAVRPNVEVRLPDQHKISFMGWLPNSRVFFWNHRQAVEYNKSQEASRWRRDNRKPIQFFNEAGDLKAGKPTLEEDLSQPPWPYYLQRYPIISSTPENIGGVECYKIGVIGDSYSMRGDLVSSAAQEAAIRQKLEELDASLASLDVLFVIDATGSMSKYYRSIRESVARIREGLEKEREKPVRYAVLYYRDYIEAKERDSWDHHFVDFEGSAEFASKFPHKTSDGGEDNPPPFFGICTGLEMASFTPKSEPAVILIGDMGNEQPDARGFTIKKVVESLTNKRCTFHAIQASPKDHDSKHRQFDEQVKEICRRLKMPDERVFSADGSDVSTAVIEHVNKNNRLASLLRKAFVILREGKGTVDEAIEKTLNEAGIRIKDDAGKSSSPAKFGEYGTWMRQELFRRLGDEGIDTRLFAEKRVQHFGIAMAPVKIPGAPDPSFVTRILLLRADFQQINSIVGVVLKRGLNPSNCSEVWRQAVNQLSGDIDQEFTFDEARPLSEYMMMALGIPVKSELLKKSVVELKRMKPDEVSKLRTTLEKLQYQQNNYNAGMSPDGKSSERHWFLLHGLEYGWIPLELMP